MSIASKIFDAYTGPLNDRDLFEAIRIADRTDPDTPAELREAVEPEGLDPGGLWDLFVEHGIVEPSGEDPADNVAEGVAEEVAESVAAPERAPEPARESEPPETGTESPGIDESPSASDEPPKLFEKNPIQHPGVYIITGHRGSGKTMLAYRLGELMGPEKHVLPVTVGLPDHVHEEFPDDWYHVDTIENAPHESVCVVDEAYAHYHARTAFDSDNIEMASLVNQSRHTGRTIFFVSQSTSHLDKTAITEADGLLMKEPGQFHGEFERRQLRSMLDEAEVEFNSLPDDANPQAYTYVKSDHYEGMVRNDLPTFHSTRLSKAYR